MKLNRKYKYIVIIILVIAIITLIIKTSFSLPDYYLEVNCPTTATNGSTISCEIYSSGINYGAVQADISYTGITQINFTKNNIWTVGNVENGVISVVSDENVTGKQLIGTIELTVDSTSTNDPVISVNNGNIYQLDSKVGVDNVRTSIHIPSANNNLTDLKINNITIDNFTSAKTEYTYSTNESNVIISATGESNTSISGTGTIELNYGENEKNIIVTSELGLTKTYKIIITRADNRSTNNYLKQIELSSGNIDFDKKTTEYNINVENNIESIQINATPEDEKSTIRYLDSNELVLEKGITNTVKILVASEKGQEKTYTLNIMRQKDKENITTTKIQSSNNYLKELTTTAGNISFNKTQLVYTLDIDNSINHITINAIPEDEKSLVSGTGEKEIIVGTNTFNIDVTSENGSKLRYVLNINRKPISTTENITTTKTENTTTKKNTVESITTTKIMDINNKLLKIIINNETIDVIDNVYDYKYDLEDVDIVDIKCILESKNATYKIEGDTNLKQGENIFIIKIISESKEEKDYKLVINKKTIYRIENDNEKILKAIKDESIKEIKVAVNNNDDKKTIDSIIVEELVNNKKSITYEVEDKEKMLYSISLDSKNVLEITKINYNINFDKPKDISLKNGNYKYINLKEEKPQLMLLKVYVGDKFKNKDRLALSYYEPTTKKVTEIEKDLIVEEGYVLINVKDYQNYILTNVKNKNKNTILYYILIGILSFVIIINLVLFIDKKRKKD